MATGNHMKVIRASRQRNSPSVMRYRVPADMRGGNVFPLGGGSVDVSISNGSDYIVEVTIRALRQTSAIKRGIV